MLNPADHAFETALRAELPEATFRPLEPRYLEEPRGRGQGVEGLLLAPASTDEVSRIVTAAHQARVGVVPYGGGTGLVQGQVMTEGARPVILSLERMRRIDAPDASAAMMRVEAGAVLADVQRAADEAGLLFPLSLGSEGSARIGGLLSTNAGGVNVLRYGNARELCLGLEAVLPDGQIFSSIKGLRKDNTGYDIRHLLIGAEGSLGVITSAALRLYPRPRSRGAAFFVVENPSAALELLALARDRVGEHVSAFELIARAGLDFITETGIEARMPFNVPPNWMCLVDLGLSGNETAEDALTDIFEAAYQRGLALDGAIASSQAQLQQFWLLREAIPEANRRVGSIVSHDISVAIAAVPEFLAEGQARLAKFEGLRINAFGHLGDGNLHYNLFPPKGESRDAYGHLAADIKRTVHDLVHEMGGSISAEHGIGRFKAGDLERYGDPAKLTAMRAIKAALDPHGIMNPGAVLRA